MKPGSNKLVIKAMYAFLYCVISFGFIACSSETDCFVADNVTMVKTIKVGETEYSIYLRLSGFQEKEAFYELYESAPRFDVCGKANFASIADVHVDGTKGTVIALVLDDKKLMLEYDSNAHGRSDFTKIPVKVKE